MTLDELRRMAELLPAGASVTLPREALLDALAGSVLEPAPPGPRSGVDLTVAQLAEHLGRGESTIRTWLERGDLPGAYRNHGREWRIPQAAVDAMQRAEATRHRREARKREGSSDRVTDIGAWRQHQPKAGVP